MSRGAPGPLPRMMGAGEFRDLGYLQEVNRLFLHPLGLALEVVVYDANRPQTFGKVWDIREADPEGFTFDAFTPEQVARAIRVGDELARKSAVRQEAYGWPDGVQPAIVTDPGGGK